MKDRYENIEIQVTQKGKQYRKPVLYPDIPPSLDDMYVISTEGDRFDQLSEQFYSRVDYWWIIAAANPFLSVDSFNIPAGLQLRIPAHAEQFLVEYSRLNA